MTSSLAALQESAVGMADEKWGPRLRRVPNVLVVPLSGFKTVSDLVAAAQAKPGSLTFGSGGVGAATHLTAERFMLSAGIKAVHVPFKGAPDMLRESEPMTMTSEKFDDFIKREIEANAAVVKAAGIRPN